MNQTKSTRPGPFLLLGLAALAASACDPTALHTQSAAIQTEVESMPEISGPDQTGTNFSMSDALAKGPVVVIFYRGHW